VMPAQKELHYFDTMGADETHWYFKSAKRKLDALRGEYDEATMFARRDLHRKVENSENAYRMLTGSRNNNASYLRYLLDGAKGARLTGDITPSYGLLSEGAMQEMLALRAGSKFIYVLRDPVDRLWSNIRMTARQKSNSDEEFGELATDYMTQALMDVKSQPMKRSDYKSTLEKLERVIPAKQRMFVFFEDLFNSETIRSICSFLGLRYHSAKTEHKVHEGRALPLGEAQRELAQVVLRDQYAAVADRFAALPERWQQNMARA
ncbi:MAG: sulfotransferase, partial [Pseudoruegeria sp.]